MSTNQLHLLARIDRVLTTAAYAVLPTVGTTPNLTVLHALGLVPAKVWLKNNARRAAVRLRSLNEGHPLVRRTRLAASSRRRTDWYGVERFKFRVQRMADRACPYLRPELLPRQWPAKPPEGPLLNKETTAAIHVR